MILLLRCLPFLVGLLEAGLFWFQRGRPELYPWVVVLGVVAVPAASFVLGWGRVRFFDLLEKMLPTFILMAALAFGLLLVEGVWAFWLVVALAGCCSFVSLELLFLLAYHPSAYPVNGLSRLNIAYVPLIVWYTVSTSSGLIVFLHSRRIWHVVLTGLLGVLLFRTTGHPGATREQNRVWMLLGALVGIEVGIVGLLLPVRIEMQGLIAATIFTAILRARRYIYSPQPSMRIAWSEAIGVALLFVATLTTAKWL